MNQTHFFKLLTTKFAGQEAEGIVQEIAFLENQNVERFKEVFATKTELAEMGIRITDKIEKIYWLILAQTGILVGLIFAILRFVHIV